MNHLTDLHLKSVISHGEANPNPFDLTEAQFEEAKKVAVQLTTVLHAETGHSIALACSSVLFLYESVLKEFLRLEKEKSRG